MPPETPRAVARGFVTEKDWRPLGIDDLEPAAWAALKDPGSTAVVAGPGAGKTEFLAQRAAFLLQTGRCRQPRRILAISYKRDSASNLARRVSARVPELGNRLVSMTFDSFTKGLVDRFKQALPPTWALREDYEINFWTSRAQADFLTALATGAPANLTHGLYAIPTDTFFAQIVGTWALPEDPETEPTTAKEFAAWSWWREHYLRPGPQLLDFTMLNRLAELIVRVTPQLRRALRLTYPFVFVDEFQDTTGAQLSFLASVFRDSAVVTAVGDRKQRIMGFAGALPNAIDEFAERFSASKHALTWNFRSSAELVGLQHIIAARLDPDTVEAVSKAEPEQGHVAASLWTYPSMQTEADHLAEWIATDIAGSTRRPRNFAIVARQKVADVEPRLATALAKHGISLRNDDALYGNNRLQDLLKHDLTRLVLGVLRLAAEPSGLGRVWIETEQLLDRVRETSVDDAGEQAISDHLSHCTAQLRAWLAEAPMTPDAAAEAVVRAAGVAGVAALTAYVAAQHRGEDATSLLASLTERLTAVLKDSPDWASAFKDVEAEDSVTLMTVHRSKGLEYHTVVFLELDDEQWWSFKYDTDEGTSAFFVGLSRAAHRLVFTCIEHAQTTGISELYDLLTAAGVDRKAWRRADSGWSWS